MSEGNDQVEERIELLRIRGFSVSVYAQFSVELPESRYEVRIVGDNIDNVRALGRGPTLRLALEAAAAALNPSTESGGTE
jgi:hypothetical protein